MDNFQQEFGYQRSLVIIKPDAVERNIVGKIVSHFENNEINVSAMKMLHLDVNSAENFYAEHRGKGFFQELVEYMTSGPVVVMVVETEDCVSKVRAVVGATDPAEAEPGTIRALHGQSMGINSIHASDSLFSAAREIKFFFGDLRSHSPYHRRQDRILYLFLHQQPCGRLWRQGL